MSRVQLKRQSNRSLIFLAAVLGLFLFTSCSGETSSAGDGGNAPAVQQQTGEDHAQQWTCPMHPDIIRSEPGECPECAMDLVAVEETESMANHDHESMEQNQEGANMEESSMEHTPSTEAETPPEGKQLWTCSMHPNVIREEPGECPICGMDLVPVRRGGGSGTSGSSSQSGGSASAITIDPVVEQNMGVRVAPVRRRQLTREVRALGEVTYDETRLAHIHTKFAGYIEETHVAATGEQVRKGEPIVEIYSPDLVSTQEEYLQAYRVSQRTGDTQTNQLLTSARRRLEFWDISDQQINHLENTGEVAKTLTLYSPFDGIVVKKEAVDGMRIEPGTHLYQIADLSEVWVESDIYEYELPWIEEGQQVEMTLSYLPGKTVEGYVDYIYPYLDSKTRTVRVRSVFPNESGRLKPGMYANMRIQSDLGEVITIPEESVIWSGERTVVFLSLGEGRFLPRDVELGALGGDGYYEVLSGIEAGDTVVTSGQFLLDSESKLREALQKMISTQDGGGEQSQTTMSGHQH